VWFYVKTSTGRQSKVDSGQHLWSVVAKEDRDRAREEAEKEKKEHALGANELGLTSGVTDVLEQSQSAPQLAANYRGPSEHSFLKTGLTPQMQSRKYAARLSQHRTTMRREVKQALALARAGTNGGKSPASPDKSKLNKNASHLKKEGKDEATPPNANNRTLPKMDKKKKEVKPEVTKKKEDVVVTAENKWDLMEQEFSTQADARLHFGAQIALECVTYPKNYLMVDAPKGTVHVRPLKEAPPTSRILMTVLDMNDVQCADPIKYGDNIWLQITCGNGDPSWEQGSVLAAKVREAPALNTVGRNRESDIRNPESITLKIGKPIPCQAVLPKGREGPDGDVKESAMSHLHTNKNKRPKTLGRWKILPATKAGRKQEEDALKGGDPKKGPSLQQDKKVAASHQLKNFSEVYLEQDWFYLGADNKNSKSGSDDVILRQLPRPGELPTGEYVVERQGVWKIHLLDTTTQSGLTVLQQQMERLLYKAKNQLKNSKTSREGGKVYDDELVGGSKFATQASAACG
jgi:hypothetical protein